MGVKFTAKDFKPNRMLEVGGSYGLYGQPKTEYHQVIDNLITIDEAVAQANAKLKEWNEQENCEHPSFDYRKVKDKIIVKCSQCFKQLKAVPDEEEN